MTNPTSKKCSGSSFAVISDQDVFRMEFALSAPAALVQVKAIPDPSLILILSDINMPGMTGSRCCPR
jgi:CheY-like chemotaxis protein